MRPLGVILLGLSLGAAACGSDDAALVQRAQQALGPFKKELKATLEQKYAKLLKEISGGTQ